MMSGANQTGEVRKRLNLGANYFQTKHGMRSGGMELVRFTGALFYPPRVSRLLGESPPTPGVTDGDLISRQRAIYPTMSGLGRQYVKPLSIGDAVAGVGMPAAFQLVPHSHSAL